MAKVAPFKALRFNNDLIPDLGKAVCPPYDVINEEQQEGFYQASPHNIIRVELNKTQKSDGLEENRYTRSASHLKSWIDSGVLKPEPSPCFYLAQTEYVDDKGSQRTRTGFFCLLKVEDFSTGVVLPHEKTFTGHKEDRFKLTEATSSNISPIFAVFPDEGNLVETALQEARPKKAAEDFIDPMGLKQKLHAVCDQEALDKVRKLMSDKVIFIADGHHRYETALAYRDHMRKLHPEAGPEAPFEYVLVYLVGMSDPGLTIFPCHRVLPKLHGFNARDFLLHAQNYFDHSELPLVQDAKADKAAVTEALAKAGEKGNSLGLVSAESDKAYILTLKKGAPVEWDGISPTLQGLDVVVLTHVVLEKILGMDDTVRDHTHSIEYVSDMAQVIEQVRSQKARTAFLVNPTRMEQVKAVAKAGEIMPRKATYFYPKVLTGLVIYHMPTQGEVK